MNSFEDLFIEEEEYAGDKEIKDCFTLNREGSTDSSSLNDPT